MSRMRRLKREKIKATIGGLALMIAIGSTGGIGSYAYFTDQGQVDNGVEITMGNFELQSSGNFNMTLQKTNLAVSSNMTITNNGSLDQYLDITFKDFKFSGNSVDLSKIPCKLTFNNGATLSSDEIKNLSQLSSVQGRSIINTDNRLYKLAPGASITCTLTIDLRSLDANSKDSIDENSITFKTNVNARQINMPEGEITSEISQ